MEKSFTSFNRKITWFSVLFSSFYLIIFLSDIHAQIVLIKGKLTASGFPVQNASVTFINNSDTTSKFPTLTDASGSYEINLGITSVRTGNNIPSKFKLEQNYPNPFSSATNITYGLNKGSDVQLIIYDILGRVVKKFSFTKESAGLHNVLWNGYNSFGQRVAIGVYFYRLDVDGESQVKKMIFYKNGNGLLLNPHFYSSIDNSFSTKSNKIQNVQGNTFTIRVQNTSTTTPLIISNELDNVVLHKDTTINLSVNYIPTAIIDPDSLHQVIRGFGAASPWYLPVLSDSEVVAAFGTGDGQIGLSILRITIEPDSTLWAKYLPSIKKAKEMGAIIIASPWYAPDNLVDSVNGIIKISHDKYNEYAAHLNSFVTYMRNNGISIYGTSVQNEPEEFFTNWTPDEFLTFMKENAGDIKGTKVMAPECFSFDTNYSSPILHDSAACANTDIICQHIYNSSLKPYPLAKQKGKEVWMTEYAFAVNNSGNNWYWAMQLAENMNDVMKADMSAYVWWTLVRYYGPIGDGTIAANPEDPYKSYPKKDEVTKRGYVMSQFSKFIRPGFYRVGSSVSPSIINIYTTAYKDSLSSKTVIVAINSYSTQIETAFRIKNVSMMTTFIPYTTSETKNCQQGKEFSVTDGNFTYTLEPSSITTFVSN